MDYGNITLFETSWEVCNKVGGIYAVVSSKALQAIENFGENYWLLGPDLGNNPDFEEDSDPVIETVGKILKAHNLKCRLGHWNIPGKPKVILVNFRNRYDQNQLLYEYWKEYQVDSMSGGWGYIEPVMFATACGEVIATIYQHMLEPIGCPAIAQFHEWMCGAGLLYLKRHCPPVGTVFTTHATMLGRSLSGNGRDLYSMLATKFDPRREAASLGITAKCSMETASAREADCFTTVSDITAEEASVVLGRKPDRTALTCASSPISRRSAPVPRPTAPRSSAAPRDFCAGSSPNRRASSSFPDATNSITRASTSSCRPSAG